MNNELHTPFSSNVKKPKPCDTEPQLPYDATLSSSVNSSLPESLIRLVLGTVVVAEVRSSV